MRFDVVTIFPGFFSGVFEHGIVRRAQAEGLVTIAAHDLRAFTHDRHRTVDDRPFGGGEGMILKPEPLAEALGSLGIDALGIEPLGIAPKTENAVRPQVILLSAQGQRFTQGVARELAGLDRVVLLCGRYEGVDERISEHLADREVSIGDYVLSGGELGAAVIMDTVTRLIPGAVGNQNSTRQESFTESFPVSPDLSAGGPSATCGSGGLLDYPHYTRPADFRGMAVPEVLVNGNHDQIRSWRRKTALAKTLRNRPDLLERVALTEEDKELLAQIKLAQGTQGEMGQAPSLQKNRN